MDGSDSFVLIIVFVVFVNHGNTCRESIWFLSDLHSKKLSTYQSGLWTLTTLTGKGRIKECEMLWPVPTEVASYMYLPSCETGNLKITQLTCLWDCDRRHLSSNCKIMWISVVVWRDGYGDHRSSGIPLQSDIRYVSIALRFQQGIIRYPMANSDMD